MSSDDLTTAEPKGEPVPDHMAELMAEPAVEPAPEPMTEPTANPAPTPDPMAELTGRPDPAPEPMAAPAPVAEPTPEPESEPEPQPEPEPMAAHVAEPVADPLAEQSPTAEVRERLVRQFERWVDEMLAGEPPPPGLPEELLAVSDAASLDDADASERQCDLYTLFSGLTTLTGEIRLQGRAFKQLIDALAPLAEVPRQLERLEVLETQQAREDETLPVAGKEVLDVMLDLSDRLERGLRTCDDGIAAMRATKNGWLRRRFAGPSPERAVEAVEAIRDASALTLERLESALHSWGVERIGQPGEAFDPDRMTAVQVLPASDVEPGTVLSVNRAGYALNGDVRLTAQVTVARAASST